MTSPTYDDGDPIEAAEQAAQDWVEHVATEHDAITDLIHDVRDRLADMEALHLLGDDAAADEVWAEIWAYLMVRRRQAARGLVRLLEPAAKELAQKAKAAGEAAIEEAIASLALPADLPLTCASPDAHLAQVRRSKPLHWLRAIGLLGDGPPPVDCPVCWKPLPNSYRRNG